MVMVGQAVSLEATGMGLGTGSIGSGAVAVRFRLDVGVGNGRGEFQSDSFAGRIEPEVPGEGAVVVLEGPAAAVGAGAAFPGLVDELIVEYFPSHLDT